jgi:hypothetical protein
MVSVGLDPNGMKRYLPPASAPPPVMSVGVAVGDGDGVGPADGDVVGDGGGDAVAGTPTLGNEGPPKMTKPTAAMTITAVTASIGLAYELTW